MGVLASAADYSRLRSTPAYRLRSTTVTWPFSAHALWLGITCLSIIRMNNLPLPATDGLELNIIVATLTLWLLYVNVVLQNKVFISRPSVWDIMKIKARLLMMLASPISLTAAQHVASSTSTEGIHLGQYRRNIDMSPSVLPNKRTRRKRQWFDDDSEKSGTNVNRTYHYYIIAWEINAHFQKAHVTWTHLLALLINSLLEYFSA